MEKDFTFKNYFTYVLRYWIIIVICAVIGMGGGMAYGVLSNNTEMIVYEGEIVVGGFGEFADYLGGISEKPEDLYSTIRSDAFSNMTAELLKRNLYTSVEGEWRSFEKNKNLSEGKAKNLFFDSFSVHGSGNVLYVTFSMNTEFVEERGEFARKTVEKYLDLAYDYARKIDSMLAQGENALSKVLPVFSDVKEDKTGLGMLKGGVVGIVAGVIVGLIIALIMYFTDKRINSYGEIAAFTGGKLLDATSGCVTSKVCPLIDREMNESKVLLICGCGDSVNRTAVLYSEYSPIADNKCLRIDFNRDGDSEADSFGEYLRGGKSADLVTHADGYDVLYGKQSWACVIKNEEKFNRLKNEYDRIIISSPYTNDGSYGVLGRICDKVLLAIDHKNTRKDTVVGIVAEINATEKFMGAVIENTGKSYVGGNVYVVKKEEE